MTNEEIIDFLAKELVDNYIFGERSDNPCEYYHYKKGDCDTDEDCRTCLIEYLRNKKPTLTDDERVILSNLRYEKGAYEYIKIGRTELDSEGNCDLILIDSDNESVWWGEYGHLFQFIKERRRI
jgi:hypothetical protein